MMLLIVIRKLGFLLLKRVASTSLKLNLRLIILLILMISGFSQFYDRSRATSNLQISDLPELSISDYQRALIITAHPDDETLGAGGFIQEALAKDLEVKVVIVTNGDGQKFAPFALNRKIIPRADDYISLGQRRQKEALVALKQLGLDPAQVIFLGYPDRRINQLWLANWNTDCPIKSAYTRLTHSPYSSTFRSTAEYCGSDLTKDFLEILGNFRPDLIILPHPNDEHPDHRATGNFARLAAAILSTSDPDYHPEFLGYLVHYGFFPQPRKMPLNASLLPPVPLSDEGSQWFRLDLDDEQIKNKLQALNQYPSQIRLLGNFLPSFARRNEIFVELPLLDFAPIELKILPLHQIGNTKGINELLIPEPDRESARRLLLKGADLVGWRIARLGDQLILTADARGRLIPGLRYRILLKTPDGETHIYTLKSSEVTAYFNTFRAQIDLAEIGDPPVLGFAADISEGTFLDRTGWNFVILRDWLP